MVLVGAGRIGSAGVGSLKTREVEVKVTAMGCVPVGWRRYPMVVVELVEIEEWT